MVTNPEFLECLVAHVSSCIAVLKGSDLRYYLVNPAFQAIVPDASLVGRTLREVFPDAAAAGLEARLRRVLETGETWDIKGYEAVVPGKPDAVWDGRVVRLPKRPREEDAVLVAITEVTERLQAGRTLLRQSRVLDGINRIFSEALSTENEEQLGKVCLAVADAITGSKFGFVGEINDEGRLDDIAISDPGWGACRLPPESKRKSPKGFPIHGLYGRVLLDAKAFFTNDPASHPDSIGTPPGHPPLNAFLGVPLFRDGRLVGMVAVANRDGGYCSEQMEDLEALAPAIVQAFSSKRAEAARQEANARLVESDRRKDEFLAMLGHELRNPLSVITSAIHLMRARGSSDPVIAKAISAADRQSAHIARLVDELLDVARITEGKVTLKQEELAIADLVDHAVESARPIIEAAGHRLYLSVARDEGRIVGDPVRLTQVIGNLLNNATKYTTSPGGEIHLVLEHADGQAFIHVRDNGVGITKDLLPHVFDLFVQGERGADRSQGGLGIGLTVARRLVEMHGGRIQAASEGPGTGSRFTISLPVLPAASSPRARKSSQQETANQRKRILVVDDNTDAAEMLTLLLESQGHDVRTAYSGLAALELAASYRPDVMLVDIGMPGMDGYEMACRARTLPGLADSKLVAITGYGQEDDRERSRAAGFTHHLVKPVDVEVLNNVLARC